MNEKKIKKMGNIENCPVRNVIDRIGDKWSMLIILLLADEQVLRFNEIHKSIGTISQKMLTVTLKSLESDGLVKRTVYPQIPPKVEYELTPRGKSLLPHLLVLTEWANKNMSNIKASRAQYEKSNA
ncbi:helix-turn-helix domain-containing protein [Cyclobacterium marinum]|uniref:winged helix-turn-helix transcriptional regulator n=1 Tax=Cyclobacterium marinum TaxID=104 RepID=UPI0030D85A35|tara:strand:+ start:56938 stop:57315 length:378 start_codon:yes stop_codon:yes gene_type:complete